MSRRHIVAVLLVVLSAGCSQAPPPAERVQAVVVSEPPRPRQEASGRRPHDGYVWVSGYWNHVNTQYVWVPGYWSVPPRGFHSWEATHWVKDNQRGWVLVRGRWK